MSSVPKPGGPVSGRSNVTPLHGRGDMASGPITRAQRAAVIIAVMGEGAAKPIVDKLDDAALAQVASALETISYLAREELAEIVIDFLQQLRQTSGAFRGGKTKARELIAGLLDESRLGAIYGETPAALPAPDVEKNNTWSRLEQQDPKKTAAYFSGLTPNIIALILRKLDVSIASDIVSHLDDQLLDPMIGHLVEAEAPDAQIDRVIAQMVEMEFLNNKQETVEEDNSHLESIGELLSLIPSDRRDRLVNVLQSTHEDKLKSIEKVIFTIDGLPDMLPRAAVPVVFRELGEDRMLKLLASLKGAGTAVSDHLLGNISSRLADQYRDQLGDVAAMPPEAIELTQREFLTALMGMKRRGAITLEKPASSS